MDDNTQVKMGFKENLLYYKWHILIALFFVTVVTILIAQACTKEEYDISVMYAGEAIIGDSQSAGIEKALEAIGKEGEKAVLYELIIMDNEQLLAAYDNGHSPTTINMERIRKNKETFALNVMSDEYFILMLSPECYDIMLENGALERLDDIGAAQGRADVRFSEYAIKLSALEYTGFYSAYDALPDNTLLCFKKVSEMGAKNTNKVKKRKHDLEFFAKMVNYSLSGTPGVSTTALLPFKEEVL